MTVRKFSHRLIDAFSHLSLVVVGGGGGGGGGSFEFSLFLAFV